MDKTAAGFKKAVIPLEGVHCASCVARIEKGLNALPGVARVSVNLPSKTAFLAYDPAQVDAAAISAKIDDLGYKVLAFTESAGSAENTALRELEREKGLMLKRFLLGVFLTGLLLFGSHFGFSAYTLMALTALA